MVSRHASHFVIFYPYLLTSARVSDEEQIPVRDLVEEWYEPNEAVPFVDFVPASVRYPEDLQEGDDPYYDQEYPPRTINPAPVNEESMPTAVTVKGHDRVYTFMVDELPMRLQREMKSLFFKGVSCHDFRYRDYSRRLCDKFGVEWILVKLEDLDSLDQKCKAQVNVVYQGYVQYIPGVQRGDPGEPRLVFGNCPKC